MIDKGNISFLKLFDISSLEDYLQEVVRLSFEYSSNYMFSYSMLDFKRFPIKFLDVCKNKNYVFDKFSFLLKIYLEKDSFFSSLYLFLNLGIKLTFNQLFQMTGYKGYSSLKKFNSSLSSNLYTGLSSKDFVFSLFTARRSIIDGSLTTADSGYLSRRLVESLREVVIKEANCFTRYIYLYRFKNVYKKLNISFLCLNNRSICLNCLNINHKLYSMNSYSKGIITSQALGEPSTQMLLRTFHLGSSISNKDKSYKHIKCLVDNVTYNNINVNFILNYVETNRSFYKYIRLNKMYNDSLIKYDYNFVKYNVYFNFNINSFSYYNNFMYLVLSKLIDNIWSLMFLSSTRLYYNIHNLCSIKDTIDNKVITIKI